jgi:homoserine kinase
MSEQMDRVEGHAEKTPQSGTVRIWAPGSLSNLGPGFDTIGMALSGIGDVVEIGVVDVPGIHLVPGGGVWEPPAILEENTAARAAASILDAFGRSGQGLTVSVRKGILPGSGLGSSAASAAGAAFGGLMLLANRVSKEAAVEAALYGEAGVSGAAHGDNVLPALLGGVVLTAASEPARFRRVSVPGPFHLAVVRPDIKVLTREARAMLPAVVPLQDAVHNASSLAFLIDALRSGDMEAVGRCIELDRLVEPVRSRLVPGYSEILGAAREAGALGAALTGSGPAMFAVCGGPDEAETVTRAMIGAARACGHAAVGIATTMDLEGARETHLFEPETII